MSTYGGAWALCGGWAADAWVGRRTREHHDVDVAVFHEDQRALFDHLAGWRLVGHDDNVDADSREPWNGRRLDPPAHVHTTRADDGFEPEFHLVEREGDDWMFRPEPRLAQPVDRVVRASGWGVPTVSPEAVLYYKALPPTWRGLPRDPPRECDGHDLRVLRPLLTDAQVDWVRNAVGSVEPAHPWLRDARLSSPPGRPPTRAEQ